MIASWGVVRHGGETTPQSGTSPPLNRSNGSLALGGGVIGLEEVLVKRIQLGWSLDVEDSVEMVQKRRSRGLRLAHN
jgi:hypothetical protein